MSSPKSFVVEINEAARACSYPDWAAALRLAAARLHSALEVLAKCPTQETMRTATSAWTRATIALRDCPSEVEPPDPTSMPGEVEGARLAA